MPIHRTAKLLQHPMLRWENHASPYNRNSQEILLPDGEKTRAVCETSLIFSRKIQNCCCLSPNPVRLSSAPIAENFPIHVYEHTTYK